MSTPRRLVKAVARPFLRPLLRRLDEVQAVSERLDRHLPLIENVIESQNAELRSGARAMDDVRAELLRLREDLTSLERRLDAREPAAAPAPDGGGARRVDFVWGSSGLPAPPGHLEVDLRAVPAAELVAHLRRLPLPERSVREIHACDVLERFTIAELRAVVLPYWHSLLAPGGRLVATGFDTEAEALLRRLAEGAGFASVEIDAGPGGGARRSQLSAAARA